MFYNMGLANRSKFLKTISVPFTQQNNVNLFVSTYQCVTFSDWGKCR